VKTQGHSGSHPYAGVWGMLPSWLICLLAINTASDRWGVYPGIGLLFCQQLNSPLGLDLLDEEGIFQDSYDADDSDDSDEEDEIETCRVVTAQPLIRV
jgi:hypothetical protein